MSSNHPDRPDDRAGSAITRRRFIRSGATSVGGLMATSALLSACGSASSASGNSETIDFWQWYSPAKGGSYSVQAQSDWFAKLAQEWNAQNAVKVKLTYIPIAQYISGTQLQAAFSAGKGPDIFVISPGDFLRYYNGGVLYDLTDALGSNVSDFYSSPMRTRTVNGRVYGIPMEDEPVLMFYSTKAFEKAGLSEGDIPKTWDELLNVADKLTGANRYGLLFETTPNVYENFTWYPFLWQGGGDVVDASGKKSAFDSKAAAAALGLWQNAVAHKVAPRTVQGGGGGDLVANLASGYTAMMPMVTAGGSFLDAGAPKFEYGVFPLPLPSASARKITIMGGWAFVVNKNSPRAAAAAKFAAWALAGPESVDRMVDWAFKAKKSLPVRKSVNIKAEQEGLWAKNKTLAYGAFNVLGLNPGTFKSNTVPFGRGEPRFTPQVAKAVTDAIQAATLGGQSPASVASQTSQSIDSALAGYNGAPLGS
jgi:multiple sugar transport system substrate-binding protein